MSSKYAIDISEKNLELIKFLNAGEDVVIEEEARHFIVEINDNRVIKTDIEFEEDLYERGYAKDANLKFVI